MKEYRIKFISVGKETQYYIEENEFNGNWKFVIGNLTREEAKELLQNPDEIEEFKNLSKSIRNALISIIIIAVVYFLTL